MTTVSELEHLLFSAFPLSNAMLVDRNGLLVGNPEAQVKGIALALDAKVADIKQAAAHGCNALVTHHPVFWPLPDRFLSNGPSAGAAVLCAAELGVALINMHTTLDCAPVAREMLLEPAGFTYSAPLSYAKETDEEMASLTTSPHDILALNEDPLAPCAALGQLGVPQQGASVQLGHIAQCYIDAFGAVAKVWGDPLQPVTQLATCSGGGGALTQRVINSTADCYVTGELAYHEVLELLAANVAVIELGHDRSELPYRFYLRDALVAGGIDETLITILEPTAAWWH